VLALDAESKGLTVAEADALTNSNRLPIKTAVEIYMEQKSGKAKKTVAQYRLALNEFMEGIKVRFMDEITENVLRSYTKFMENRGHAGKTVDTRINIVFFLLKKNGVKVRLPRDEMPTIEEEAAVPYTKEQLDALFAGMKKNEIVNGKEYSGPGFGQAIPYLFFLGTGCRDQEVVYAAWNDIDFTNKTYHIRRKDDVGFAPKNHEARVVPLPDSLVAVLKALQRKAPNDRWIFTNTEGQPDHHFLGKLKALALRIGLNCGQCWKKRTVGTYHNKRRIEVSCKDHPVCKQFYLHRFRKSCATQWEQNGVPIRTIQYYLSHKSLETTMKYLGITASESLRSNINQAFRY
jgi:integrase